MVDAAGWGCFVRAKADGDRDLAADVHEITAELAREMLGADPESFPDEPDEASKLRKLQTYVKVDIGERVEFRVVDSGRARKVAASSS